jgi:hypothetical protein
MAKASGAKLGGRGDYRAKNGKWHQDICKGQTESWRDRMMQKETTGRLSSMILSGRDSVVSGWGFAALCSLRLNLLHQFRAFINELGHDAYGDLLRALGADLDSYRAGHARQLF